MVTFVLPIHGHGQLFGIFFTWICSVIQIGSHVCKVNTDCNVQVVLLAGSPLLKSQQETCV
jgi:hypothetical protein